MIERPSFIHSAGDGSLDDDGLLLLHDDGSLHHNRLLLHDTLHNSLHNPLGHLNDLHGSRRRRWRRSPRVVNCLVVDLVVLER
jgi:hypothetical protein